MNLPEAIEILTAAGTEHPRFEAQLLLAQALGVERIAVVAGTIPRPDTAQEAEFERLVRDRAKRVPMAYLRGTKAFYGLEFAVSSAVLVPARNRTSGRRSLEFLSSFPLYRTVCHCRCGNRKRVYSCQSRKGTGGNSRGRL